MRWAILLAVLVARPALLLAQDVKGKTIRFAKADAGKLPAGWTSARGGSGDKGSVWMVVADPSTPSKAGFALAQTAKGKSAVFNICVVDGTAFKEGEVRVWLRPRDGKIDQGGGVVWRYKDAKNYYLCRYNPLEANFRLYRVVDDRRIQIGTAEDVPDMKDAWRMLVVTHVGERIACFLDGKKLLEVTDKTPAVTGQVGLWTKADAVTWFDLFVFGPVRPIGAVPDLPEGVSSFGAVVSDGHLYVYGGHRARMHTYHTEAVSGAFRRLKLRGSAWEELPGGPGLQGMNLAAHGGKVYRAGGMQPRNKEGEPADNHSVAEAAVYDPKARRWEKLPDLPSPRSSHDLVVLGDKLYVVGGWALRGKATRWCEDTVVMDLKADKPGWKSVPQAFARRALTAVAHEGKLYVLGGLRPKGGPSQEVDIFDPASGRWTSGPEFPEGKMHGFSPAACSLGGHLYLSVADGTVYRLGKGRWEAVAKGEVGRVVHRLVAEDERHLLVIGGGSRGGNVASIERIAVVKGGKRTSE